eukprot:CAMPEP_0115015100 /NCGR_PEP_ID=MMETSP0216-20121206/26539_1 /TAXON_ID=223996 /ORGANISM="Protocruzia adherens, Strain Boccale" /LENGTH=465 /DNA_ID=CAMNT_0002385099 /DNA_START=34 /DNA_END=1431 /DNA_ORIENTATION=+
MTDYGEEDNIILKNLNADFRTMESRCEEVSSYLNHMRETWANITESYDRMIAIDQESTQQQQVSLRLLGQLELKKSELQDSLDRFANLTALPENLKNIFEKLKTKRIEKEIFDFQELDSFQTLYDFVDAEVVNELIDRSNEEYTNLKSAFGASTFLLNQLIKGLKDQLSRLTIAKNELEIEYGTLKTRLGQGQDIEELSSRLLEPTRILLKKISELDFEILGTDIKEQANKLREMMGSDLEQSKINAEALSENISKMTDLSEDFEANCLRFVQNVEQKKRNYFDFVEYGKEAREQILSFDQKMKLFQESQQSNEEIFEEIQKLIKWYEYFLTSYEKLVPELIRRQRREQAFQQRVREMQAEMDEWFKDELKERQGYIQEHERYLPNNLRVPLQDPPTRYLVFPQEPMSWIWRTKFEPQGSESSSVKSEEEIDSSEVSSIEEPRDKTKTPSLSSLKETDSTISDSV